MSHGLTTVPCSYHLGGIRKGTVTVFFSSYTRLSRSNLYLSHDRALTTRELLLFF